jgi:hypothetical protein
MTLLTRDDDHSTNNDIAQLWGAHAALRKKPPAALCAALCARTQRQWALTKDDAVQDTVTVFSGFFYFYFYFFVLSTRHLRYCLRQKLCKVLI